VKKQEPAGLDDQPDQEGISVIHFEEVIEIDFARLREPRMAGNILKPQPQRRSNEALQFVLLQAQLPGRNGNEKLPPDTGIRKLVQVSGALAHPLQSPKAKQCQSVPLTSPPDVSWRCAGWRWRVWDR
jgi:hypothetical protein